MSVFFLTDLCHRARFFSMIWLALLFAAPAVGEYWLGDTVYAQAQLSSLISLTRQQTPLKPWDNRQPAIYLNPKLHLTHLTPKVKSHLGLSMPVRYRHPKTTSAPMSLAVHSAYIAWQQPKDGQVQLGRFQLAHTLPDDWHMSLGKNDVLEHSTQYSQGLLLTHRRGIVQQQWLSEQRPSKYGRQNSPPFTHYYRLKLGVEGYFIGPLYVDINHNRHRSLNQTSTVKDYDRAYQLMLGSALQWPAPIGRGIHQLAFQYAQQGFGKAHAQTKKMESQPHAWQISLNWRGFNPRHSLGLLTMTTSKDWLSADSLAANRRYLAARYRWPLRINNHDIATLALRLSHTTQRRASPSAQDDRPQSVSAIRIVAARAAQPNHILNAPSQIMKILLQNRGKTP